MKGNALLSFAFSVLFFSQNHALYFIFAHFWFVIRSIQEKQFITFCHLEN